MDVAGGSEGRVYTIKPEERRGGVSEDRDLQSLCWSEQAGAQAWCTAGPDLMCEAELCQASCRCGPAHQGRHPDSQKKGLFFSGSDCVSAFAGDGVPFAPATSSTYRAAEYGTAPLAQGSGLVPPRCCRGHDTAAHVPARPPAASHLQRASQG